MVKASQYGNNLMHIGWIATASICFVIQLIILIHWVYNIFPNGVSVCGRKKNKENSKRSSSNNNSIVVTKKESATVTQTKHSPKRSHFDFKTPSADDMIIENENEMIDFDKLHATSNSTFNLSPSPSGSPVVRSTSTTPRKHVQSVQSATFTLSVGESGKKKEKKKESTTSDMDSRLITLTTLALIIGFLFALSSVAMTILSLYLEFECASQMYRSIMVQLERWCVYCFFLLRLKLLLNGTMYEYKHNQLQIIGIIMSISQLSVTIFYNVYIVYYECHQEHIVRAMIPMAGLDIIIGIVLLLLFLVKMCKFIKQLTINGSNRNVINDRTASLRYVSTKLTICAITAIISSFILLMSYPILLFAAPMIDITINSLCLIFSFKMYDTPYRAFFKLCRLCCEKNAIEQS